MFIITQAIGQLGNQLILFSHLIAFAIENKVTVSNPAFNRYATFFQTTNDDFFCRYPAKNSLISGNTTSRKIFYHLVNKISKFLIKSKINNRYLKTIAIEINEDLCLDSQEFLASLDIKQTVLLQGFRFRDETNIIKYADEIRAYFMPMEKYINNIYNLLNKLRESSEILVGVHIRQGDFKNFKGGKNFYETDVYIKIMSEVKNLFPHQEVAFLVCSNVRQDPKNFADFNYHFGTSQIIEDLYSLAGCNYIIAPQSTYSTWASFYGKVPLYRIKDSHDVVSLDNFKIYVPGMDYKYLDGLTLNI